MTVLLTSFKRYFESPVRTKDLPDGRVMLDDVKGFSIAVYQPEWYPRLDKIDLFDIRDNDGQWVRPRNFVPDDWSGRPDIGILSAYHDTLLDMYLDRWSIGYKMGAPVWDEDVAFCCWCPYDTAAKRQLRDYGSFVCHSWPVETFLKTIEIDVVRDEDRERMVR